MTRALLLVGVAACSYTAPQDTGDDVPVPGDDARRDGSTDGDAATDAAPPIDAPFDPATQCPPEYDIVIGGLTSRYRAILTQRNWALQHADCADDLPGKTHLIAYDDANELAQVGTQSTPRFLVGHFQMAGQMALGANWFKVTGGAVDPAFWLGGQPNDNNNSENGEQDRAFINYNTGTGVQDGEASFQAEALCECDGQPVPPQVEAML